MVEYGVVVVGEAAHGGIADRSLTVRRVASYVLFHGTSDISRAHGAGPLSLRVLGHFGQADPWEPPEQGDQVAAQLRAAGAAVTVYWYAGAGHLFTDPGLPEFDPAATALAWQRTLVWLEPGR
jgi:dienelactone hydrolase